MDVSLLPTDSSQHSAASSIEISVRGKWLRVPALEAYGQVIAINGKWIRIAATMHIPRDAAHVMAEPTSPFRPAAMAALHTTTIIGQWMR